jgi:hypothetical protein
MFFNRKFKWHWNTFKLVIRLCGAYISEKAERCTVLHPSYSLAVYTVTTISICCGAGIEAKVADKN